MAAAAGAAGVLLHSGSAAADDPAQGPVLQEVVVSAQKRDTKLQETPISISAVTGADLAAAGISDVQALAQRTPGVAISSAGPGRSVYNINGISSAAGSSSTVGFYLDDIPLTPATDGSQTARFFFDPDLFDVARVEVLRGPQGTLYGAGSMGGTIRIIANAPQLSQFSAAASADGSDTSHGGTNWSANAMLNIPLLGDLAALRIAVSEKNYDGWIDRVVLNPFPVAPNRTTRGDVLAAPVARVAQNVNTEDLQAARIRLLVEPLAQMKITLGFDYQHMSQGGYDTVDVPPGGQYYAHYAAFDTPEPAFDQSKVFSANLQYSFDNVQLISTSALVERDSMQTEETGENYNYLFGTPVLPTQIINAHTNRQFSEEARLVSTGDGPLQYVVGFFYENFTNSFHNNSVVPEYLALFGTDKVAVSRQQEHLKQVAGFGELTYKFLDHWSATAGLRWYHFNDDDYTNTGLSITAAPPPLNVQSQSASGGTWLPKVSVSYQPSQQLLTYFTYSQGSRIGGNNINVPTSGPNSCVPFLDTLGLTQVPPSYEGDSVKSFELGAKSTLLNGRVTLNASMFYINWDKVQQEAILGCGYPLTLNEGTAVSKGGNLELNAQLSPAWRAGMSTGYTNARVGETIPGIVTAGEQLQNVPKFTQSAWLDLEQPLTGRLSLIGRVSNSYYGSSRDTGYKPAYDLVSWRLGVAGNDTWSASVYMDNVTNRVAYLSNTISLAATIPILDRVATNRPRTTGIELKYRF